MSRPAWMDRAECALTYGPSFDREPVAVQIATCLQCPVRAECLAYALKFETGRYLTGSHATSVWGGTTIGQRRKLRKAVAA